MFINCFTCKSTVRINAVQTLYLHQTLQNVRVFLWSQKFFLYGLFVLVEIKICCSQLESNPCQRVPSEARVFRASIAWGGLLVGGWPPRRSQADAAKRRSTDPRPRRAQAAARSHRAYPQRTGSTRPPRRRTRRVRLLGHQTLPVEIVS